MKNPIIIAETDRLILRKYRESDLQDLYEYLSDPEVVKYEPYRPMSLDEARVRRWITRNMERYQQDGFGLWAVALKETGEMIGDCGITMQSIHGTILPEIGYHIRKDQQRKGYASEAAAECIRYAFENYDFPAVYSYMKYTNVASYSTAIKNGMRFIEQYEDPDNIYTRVYAITREEWEQKCRGSHHGDSK